MPALKVPAVRVAVSTAALLGSVGDSWCSDADADRRGDSLLVAMRISGTSPLAMTRLTPALVLLVASAACGGRALQASGDEGPDGGDATAMAAQLEGAAPPEDAAADATLDGSPAVGDAADDGGPAETTDAPLFISDAGGCGTGIVTFRLEPGPDGPWQFTISGDEEANWLAVLSTSGRPFYRSPSESTTLDCSNCQASWAIPIGTASGDLGDAGTEETWDGRYFAPDDAGTCAGWPGGPYGSGCVTRECAPPGPYVAFMCACGPGAPASSGLPSSYGYAVGLCANPTCVRVPFEYPSPTAVVGTVGGSNP